MNKKHLRFVDEYLIDQNATRAAIDAGYSANSARSQGSRLLTNADIVRTINERQQVVSKELEITASDKRKKLLDITLFCSEQVADGNGQMKMRDARAATSAIAELNKMDGEYRQALENLPHINFIQYFGEGIKNCEREDITIITG